MAYEPIPDKLSEADVIAIQSWEASQEPWHLEPPPDGHTEYQREQDWEHLTREAKIFAGRYGVKALVRCISDACE